MLTAQSAHDKWPCVRLQVDETIVYNGPIQGKKKISYSARSHVDQENCTIHIEYYNKSQQDTVVDEHGNIIENQSVSIVSIVANGVDLVQTNIIHRGFGQYTMKLDDDKRQYFINNNISVGPNTSLHMFENGVWCINLKLPILSFITGQHDIVEPWERVQVEELVKTLYDQYLVCKELEHKNDI